MEKIMQYVWEHRLWLQSDMVTIDGRRVRVLDPGQLNRDAGPDFFNAKVIIGERTWAGNIEIHVRASDWHRHGHTDDPAYGNVVLHVVQHDDTRIRRGGSREEIPQVVLACARDFGERYRAMVSNPATDLPCHSELASIPAIYITDWMGTLGFERLYAKVDRINDLVRRLNGDWQSAAYVTLARALGFGVNNDAFERLALATPLKILLQHRDDPTSIEGLLFGQAGFLDITDCDNEEYIGRLRTQYTFLASKFGLRRPEPLGWKMARMRPQTFPHRRLAALAAMIAGGFTPAYRAFSIETAEEARSLFDISLTGYWSSHCNFRASRVINPRAFGPGAVDGLLINVVAPLMCAYGLHHGNERRIDAAVELLHSVAPESNRITDLFACAGVECRDAFTSQALIQLRRNYCEPRKCLYCRIGHRLLARKAKASPAGS